MKIKNYRFGFDIWGLLLFLLLMFPNLIWFLIPAPYDVLRAASLTGTLDTVASVCQGLFVAALCFIKSKESKKLCVTSWMIGVIGCCFLYFTSWIVYYAGIVNAIVILGLTVPPCFAFLFFAFDRKNGIALIPITVFTSCHLIYGIVNYIM